MKKERFVFLTACQTQTTGDERVSRRISLRIIGYVSNEAACLQTYV